MRIPVFRIVLLFWGVLLIPGMASADAISLGVASDASVTQGSSFVVDVNISNAVDLYDFQLDLFYNPAVLQVAEVTEGSFLPGSGATFFLPGFVDNGSGNVTFNADTLETAIPGANGNGTLIEFHFDAIGEGTSFLNLDNIILGDSQGNLISSATTNGSVTVTTGSATVPTPEPDTLALLAVGLLTIGLRRFRR